MKLLVLLDGPYRCFRVGAVLRWYESLALYQPMHAMQHELPELGHTTLRKTLEVFIEREAVRLLPLQECELPQLWSPVTQEAYMYMVVKKGNESLGCSLLLFMFLFLLAAGA